MSTRQPKRLLRPGLPTDTTDRTYFRIYVLTAILIGALVALFTYLEANLNRFYIFNPQHLKGLQTRALAAHGNDTRSVATYIVEELRAEYPGGYITAEEDWVFNNAGGAMGGMWLLHASVTEYLIIFGSAVGTEGHSGRHTADDYFHILKGTQKAYSLGSFEPEVYEMGTVHHLRRGDVKQYKMDADCFALEYARGWIPPMMFFGLADSLTSTLDIPTLYKTVWITAREMAKNLIVLRKL